jgi:hypothetical protein
MEADTIGNRDYIAIVVSKDELDYNDVNRAISNSRQATYQEKVNEALQGILIRSPRFNAAEGNVYFRVDANDNKAVACVVAFDKQ